MAVLLVGARAWERSRLGPPPRLQVTPSPPPTVTRITEALKAAPYVIRTVQADTYSSRYYWKSGKLVAAYAKTGRTLSAYSQGTVWETEEDSTTGTIQPSSKTVFPPEFFAWKEMDFRSSKQEAGKLTYYAGTTEFRLTFDPKTYLPLSQEEIQHRAPAPRRAFRAPALPGGPPTPVPEITPVPTPRPVPFTTNRIHFAYPKQPPVFIPSAQFPPRTWVNVDEDHARWLQRFQKPLLEFPMLQSKLGLLHVERNAWGDVFLYLAGNYPFGPGYHKSGGKKRKVTCKIQVEVDGKPEAYAYPMPIYTSVLPATIGDRNLRVLVLPNLSLKPMPEPRRFQVNFVAVDQEGAVVEKQQWSRAAFPADYAFAPPQFPLTGDTLSTYSSISGSRIGLWYNQALSGNTPEPQVLERLHALLKTEESAPQPADGLEQARWRLVQLYQKANQPDRARKLAQEAQRAYATRPSIDWSEVLQQLATP